MSKYSSKNSTFQFGLALFTVLGLAIGIILTTGKASLNLFSFASLQTDYYLTGRPCVGTGSTCNQNTVYNCVGSHWVNDKNGDCTGRQMTCQVTQGIASCQDLSSPPCYNKNYECGDNKYYTCKNGKQTLIQDCTQQGKVCLANQPGYTNGCYFSSALNYTRCGGGVTYSCKVGGECTVKHICQNGCEPSDLQMGDRSGTTPAKCISTYERYQICFDNKIYRCDGTYCTIVLRDCGKENLLCKGYGSTTHCEAAPDR